MALLTFGHRWGVWGNRTLLPKLLLWLCRSKCVYTGQLSLQIVDMRTPLHPQASFAIALAQNIVLGVSEVPTLEWVLLTDSKKSKPHGSLILSPDHISSRRTPKSLPRSYFALGFSMQTRACSSFPQWLTRWRFSSSETSLWIRMDSSRSSAVRETQAS